VLDPMKLLRKSRAFPSGFRRLPPPVWSVFLIQIIVRGGDFVFPFLTLFLTRKLGLGIVDAGLWVMGTSAMAVLGILISGRLGDRVGRKSVLGVCMASSALLLGTCCLLPLTAIIPAVLLVASLFQGAMKPLLGAVIMDLCPMEQRREGFSLSYMGTNLGVAVGPMMAGLLFEDHLRWLFLGNSLALLCAVGILSRLSLVPPGLQEPASGSEKAYGGSLAGALLERPALLAFYALTLLVSFAYSQTSFGLILYSAESFGGDSAAKFGTLMSFNAMTVLASTALLTRATRRLSPLMSMALGTGLYALGFGMLAFRLGMGLLMASTFIWTQGEVLLAINSGPFLASQSPSNFRGRFQALRETLWSAGAILSPLAFGAIIARLGIHFSWSVVAATALCCSAGFLALRRRSARPAAP
jgi:MFS family permease